MQKIFIIEDDDIIRKQLKLKLETWKYEVDLVQDYQNITSECLSFNPDLILLDIKLPYYDGYYWCLELRKKTSVPIIFISSVSDSMNQIMAMNLGADDFIAKPFNMDLLVAKVQAVLRRTTNTVNMNDTIECKGLVLNTNDYKITYNNQSIDLTKNEYRILLTLMQNEGKIITRDLLMQKLWNTDIFIDDNTLTVNVTRLRKKIESLGLNDYIITKKGSGYKI